MFYQNFIVAITIKEQECKKRKNSGKITINAWVSHEQYALQIEVCLMLQYIYIYIYIIKR